MVFGEVNCSTGVGGNFVKGSTVVDLKEGNKI